MTEHHVKSWTPFFQAIKEGTKTHELRVNDRDYKVGDILYLEEYEPFDGKYTGEKFPTVITYITSSQYPCAFSSAVLNKEYCILSIRKFDPRFNYIHMDSDGIIRSPMPVDGSKVEVYLADNSVMECQYDHNIAEPGDYSFSYERRYNPRDWETIDITDKVIGWREVPE